MRLGWAPRWDLDQALRSIVSWYKAFQAGDDPREVSLGQIEEFTKAPVPSA
jgi:CDP-glucose 4,6-dehydratase